MSGDVLSSGSDVSGDGDVSGGVVRWSGGDVSGGVVAQGSKVRPWALLFFQQRCCTL